MYRQEDDGALDRYVDKKKTERKVRGIERNLPKSVTSDESLISEVQVNPGRRQAAKGRSLPKTLLASLVSVGRLFHREVP